MSPSPSMKPEGASPGLRYVVSPTSAARFLVLPLSLTLPMPYLLPYLRPFIPSHLQSTGNLFTPFSFLSRLASMRTPHSIYDHRDVPRGRREGTAYSPQQFFVLILGPEKRRSDHWELVIHHVVTVWMVSWSYLMYITLLGNAVFASIDVPDVSLAFSELLNYLQLERAKVVSFAMFVVGWTAREEEIGPLGASNPPRYHGVDGLVCICVLAYFISGDTRGSRGHGWTCGCVSGALSSLAPHSFFLCSVSTFLAFGVRARILVLSSSLALSPFSGDPSAWLWYSIVELRSWDQSTDFSTVALLQKFSYSPRS
ncbi:Sphingosine N-acyltransferase lac1 [Mycena venus]|uniref:Sphingosine N-acyltransferase lac1 n=1 Tax=Mycena venus TaxID=2733690 RepID=A0A8H6YWB1_9AGAR|nr:Sphingosine N-acyltransferase lac1 [Mycena venus]